MRHCIATPRGSIASWRGMLSGGFVQRDDRAATRIWPAHQVDAGDHLGDRVLHLDARVDLDEVELAAVDVEQELDRPGAAVSTARHSAGRARRFASRSARGRLTLGATSTTFWWRRCTEQSRSQRCTRLPCASPSTCTSMCLARGM